MTACWAMVPAILATVGFMSVRPHSSLCALKAALSMLQGFFYNCYPVAEKTGAGDLGTETDINEDVMLVYHRVGTPQSEDVVVLAGGLGPLLGPTGRWAGSKFGSCLLLPLQDIPDAGVAAVERGCLLFVAHLVALWLPLQQACVEGYASTGSEVPAALLVVEGLWQPHYLKLHRLGISTRPYSMAGMAWYGKTWLVWQSMAGMARHGWYGMVWLVWHGMAWPGLA